MTDAHFPPDLLAATAAFNAAIEAAFVPGAAWQALQRFADSLIGAKLFTVMTVDMPNELARRQFTSDPVAYPASGSKPIQYNRWFDIVHKQRQNFVANTIAEIATVFPDHETIWSLGCGSVVNVPVVIDNVLVATVNMLHEEHFYTPERVASTAHLALPAKIAYLVEKQLG
jgi:hypothetical protein